VAYSSPVIVQRYIKNPLLIRGYKFDLRIYVLLTSIKPLEIFLYKEGFARFSTETFSLNPASLQNNQIHLTNYSIQKHYIKQGCTRDLVSDPVLEGSKISLRTLKMKLKAYGVKWKSIWKKMQEVIIKTLIMAVHAIPHQPNNFELFGFDIMFDRNLKCWLIEVNSSPSLARDFFVDELIK